VPFFGVEEDQSLFFHDGHFNLQGEQSVAKIFLKRVTSLIDGSRTTMSTLLNQPFSRSRRQN
ncbi:MAG: hypothetical protein KGJ07_07540, partial [Patescibacteria group bacterium]|nr:hypothetical protein [Patescibacteria group bacterium]